MDPRDSDPVALDHPAEIEPGDRVTLHDPDGSGGVFEAVVVCNHGTGTINALYRPEGDGSFGDCRARAEYTIATSITPAEGMEGGPSFAWTPGWTWTPDTEVPHP